MEVVPCFMECSITVFLITQKNFMQNAQMFHIMSKKKTSLKKTPYKNPFFNPHNKPINFQHPYFSGSRYLGCTQKLQSLTFAKLTHSTNRLHQLVLATFWGQWSPGCTATKGAKRQRPRISRGGVLHYKNAMEETIAGGTPTHNWNQLRCTEIILSKLAV